MNVYLVHCEYYDYHECAGGSRLLGIYSSMELAMEARKSCVEAELECASAPNNPARLSMDADNNPVVTMFYFGEPVEDSTFTIEEWVVH